jgi:hypothetical protein
VTATLPCRDAVPQTVPEMPAAGIPAVCRRRRSRCPSWLTIGVREKGAVLTCGFAVREC